MAYAQAAAIADIQNKATATDAATAAATRTTEYVESLIKEKTGAGVLSGGATASDDLASMGRAGFSASRIYSDYQKAIYDQNTGTSTADDAAAVDRYSRMVADKTAIQKLNALLETFGADQQAFIAIIQDHNRRHTTTAQEIQALQAAANALSQRNDSQGI